MRYVVSTGTQLLGFWQTREGAEFHIRYLENQHRGKQPHRKIHEVDEMAKRSCLHCSGDFPSWGAGNRRCLHCHELFTKNNGVLI